MRALLLFAKRPRPGQVKTRLVPPLTSAQAVALYRAFLEDQLAFLRDIVAAGGAARAELWLDGAWAESTDGTAPRLEGIGVCRQPQGGLGARLAAAVTRARAGGATVTAIVGADAPTVPAALVERACAAVEGGTAEAAVVPAADGGYVALALGHPLAAVLSDALPWGTAGLLAATRRSAAAAGVRLAETAPWYDVDVGADLDRLRRDLAGPEGCRRAPATAAALAAIDAARDGVV